MPGGWEWLIIVGIVLLLFGAKKLPEMARSIGQSARVFKGEMKGMKADDDRAPTAADAPPQPALPAVPSTQPAPEPNTASGTGTSERSL